MSRSSTRRPSRPLSIAAHAYGEAPPPGVTRGGQSSAATTREMAFRGISA